MKIRLSVQTPTRLDSALLDYFRNQNLLISRKELRSFFQKNSFFYQKKRLSPSYLLSNEMEIDFHGSLPPPTLGPAPDGNFIPILFEDEHYLVLDKPSGTPSAPLSTREQDTAVNAALSHCPELRQVEGFGPLEPGLLHRLDTETSGILTFVKTQKLWEELRSAWKKREITKIYRAVVHSEASLPKLPIQLTWPLSHDSHSKKKMKAHLNGEPFSSRFFPAKTHLLSSHAIDPKNLGIVQDPKSYLDLIIHIDTGVMHQIRCHLAALGVPILGDILYGGLPAPRIFLHAWKLQFKKMKFESPLPADWPKIADE